MKSVFCIRWRVAATVMILAVQYVRADERAGFPANNAKPESLIGQVKEIKVDSNSGKTSVLIHVESGNIMLDEFRVLFNTESGKALSAWWMTKGMFNIALPKAGLLLKSIPGRGSQVRVHFNRDVPKESSSVFGIRLLSLAEAKPVRKSTVVNFLTIAQVRQIEQRIPKLKKGMTQTEVFKTLGFNLRKKTPVFGDGPSSHYANTYFLRDGYNLVLVFDDTKRPARFKSANMLKFKAV